MIFHDYVLIGSSVSSLDFHYSFPRDQSRDATPRLGVFVILQCTSFRVCIFILANYDDNRGRVDDLSFFEYLSPCCFLLIEFHCSFFISYEILPYFVYYYCIWLGRDRPSGLLLFVPALLLSMLTPLFLPCSSVSLSYFVLAVPMRECLGKHSCMSCPCSIAILNGTFLFSPGEIVCNLGRSFVYQNQN